jgi:LDH2 family malate/lactate/ureidoglycolate dehydrogenase
MLRHGSLRMAPRKGVSKPTQSAMAFPLMAIGSSGTSGPQPICTASYSATGGSAANDPKAQPLVPTVEQRQILMRPCKGALAASDGHRGFGLGLTVQLLGALCNSPAMSKGLGAFGCLFVVMRGDRVMSTAACKINVAEYANTVRAARPVAGRPTARMPCERSAAARRKALAAGVTEVADPVYAKLLGIAGS